VEQVEVLELVELKVAIQLADQLLLVVKQVQVLLLQSVAGLVVVVLMVDLEDQVEEAVDTQLLVEQVEQQHQDKVTQEEMLLCLLDKIHQVLEAEVQVL
jgi:hypothetical protein|tara:strand:+ start:49 stop:345 length:297 start_codon:yes stop_codon:yes gene_type:complete